MAVTTIKLESELRDALNAEARRQGTTAGSVVQQLWDAWLREQRFAAIREAMATTGAAGLDDYAEESAAFDVTSSDGLTEAQREGSREDPPAEVPQGPSGSAHRR